jgi:ribosome-binding protein aMBF1 (putative translation factor)
LSLHFLKMRDLEKFQTLVIDNETDNLNRNRERIKNRPMLKVAQNVAIKVLVRIDELGWSYENLAAVSDISKEQIQKIVSGKENSTIETLTKLENTLGIEIFSKN